MSVTVTIHEEGCETRNVTLSRVPCAWEWINVDGTKYHAINVEHMADVQSDAVRAVVSVLRESTLRRMEDKC